MTMNRIMQFLFVLFLVLLVHVPSTLAHVPVFVSQPTSNGIITIDDPIVSQSFYGALDNAPHTYAISSSEAFTLSLQILVPDIETSKNNISGIIVKLPESGGRVTEVARLSDRDASWESWYEPFGGDFYRKGATYSNELEPGNYRIEVHTPDNLEKYVLVVGSKEDMTIGYFEMIRRLIAVKVFFDKSPFRIIESLFVYGPLLVVSFGVVLWQLYRRRLFMFKNHT